MPKTVAIIPARYASTRLPGKSIKSEAREHTGKYLIEHIYRNVMNAKNVHEVIVATDNERIAEVVKQFGGSVKMTSTNHKSGTDRVAEVASSLNADFVVNIQGDEPDVKGRMIDDLIETTSFLFLKHLGIYMYSKDFLLRFSSLAIPDIEGIEKLEQLRVPSNGCKVKVIVTHFMCEGVDISEDFERFLDKYRI